MRSRRAAALASLALAVTACGGDAGKGSTSALAGSGFPDLSGQILEVAAVWSGAEQVSFAAVLDRFEARTGATVKYTSTGTDIARFLATKVKGGRPPDVAVLPQPSLFKKLATEGSLEEASPQVAAEVDANFASIWRTTGSSGGKFYGVYFKATNKSTVWYRPEAFDDAGVAPPATWEEFLTTVQTLADSGAAPVSVGGRDGWTLTDWFENVYLRQAGPERYDQLTRHEIAWTHPSVKDALTTLGQLWGKPGAIVPGALRTDFPTSVVQVFSDNPRGAIVYEGDFVASFIGSTKARVGTDALVFDFPSINGSSPSVVGGGDVAVAMKDSNGAQVLLRYLATPEAAAIWARRGGFISANRNMDAANYPDDTSRAIGKALVEAGDRFRFDMSDLMPPAFGGTRGTGEWKVLQDFLARPSDVAGASARLEEAGAMAFK